jgi:hypothetical protein
VLMVVRMIIAVLMEVLYEARQDGDAIDFLHRQHRQSFLSWLTIKPYRHQ